MLIDIDKIVVKDRIRKDYGDIKELADDINRNGLINPPAISRNNELIAGERRLRACKSLGWKQIEVHQMDVDDAEKQLYMEISENESRKEFTMTERLDYARRLTRVESAKAKERMSQGGKEGVQNSAQVGKSRDKVAEQIGMSHDTLRKAQQIEENKDLIDAKDFADWDEGKLSTNKVYQQLKFKLAQAETDLTLAKSELKAAQNRQPRVVEKRVEVIPDDYDKLKSKARQADAYRKDFENERTKSGKSQQEINKLKEQIRQIQEDKTQTEMHTRTVEGSLYFAAGCANFIRDYGGYVWITEHLEELSDKEKDEYKQAILGVYSWAQTMLDNFERGNRVNEQ